MELDWIWVLFAVAVAAAIVITYLVGVEVGRSRERRGRVYDIAERRERALRKMETWVEPKPPNRW